MTRIEEIKERAAQATKEPLLSRGSHFVNPSQQDHDTEFLSNSKPDMDWLLERNAELLKAIRGLVYLTDQGREGGLILSRADRKPITNGDQYVIDSAYIAAEGAIAAMEKTS